MYENVCFNIDVHKHGGNQCKVVGGWQQTLQGQINPSAILNIEHTTTLHGKYTYDQCKYLLEKLTPIIDDIVGSAYGDKWQIILGPFMITYLQFFVSCQSIMQRLKEKEVKIVVKKYSDVEKLKIPKDFQEFSKILFSVEGQEQLFTFFAVEYGLPMQYVNLEQFKNDLNKQEQMAGKNTFFKILKKISVKFRKAYLKHFSFSRVYIPNISTTNSLYTIGWELLGLIYVAPTHTKKTKYSAIISNSREVIFDRLAASLEGDGDYLKPFVKSLKFLFPLSYIENHSVIQYFLSEKKVKAAISSHSHITSDEYRIWLARNSASEREFKIGTYQHGGFGLIDSLYHCPIALWEQDIADHYFTWGSGSAPASQKNYVGGIRKCSMLPLMFPAKKTISKILIVIEQPPLSPVDFKSFKSWEKMLQDVAWSVRKLDEFGYRTSVRLYYDETKEIQKNILLKYNSNIQFSPNGNNFACCESIDSLVVFTYFSSGFFERMMAKKPTIIWTQNQYKIDSRYSRLFQEMRESCLYCSEKEDLVKFVSLNYKKLTEWWTSGSVVKCSNKIRDLFAQERKSLLSIVLQMKK